MRRRNMLFLSMSGLSMVHQNKIHLLLTNWRIGSQNSIGLAASGTFFFFLPTTFYVFSCFAMWRWRTVIYHHRNIAKDLIFSLQTFVQLCIKSLLFRSQIWVNKRRKIVSSDSKHLTQLVCITALPYYLTSSVITLSMDGSASHHQESHKNNLISS